MAYKIDSYYCVGCEACYRACEFGAVEIVVEEHNCRINPEHCTECASCVDECPVDIITLADTETRERTETTTVKYTKIWIEESECIGCSKCKRKCPENAIDGVKKQPFHIDESKCIKCGICLENCPKNAVHGR